MKDDSFAGQRILVVGGAGFVGSNLVLELLKYKPEEIIIVDNLLSSESRNIIKDKRVRFILGSITDDKILASVSNNLDYVFHLACFHGNQSSISDPLADHQNNTLTSLKLFDTLSKSRSLKKVVYAAAACAVAEKTYEKAIATTEDQPISLYHDSPYSISKIIGELYGNYYYKKYDLPLVKARFSNVYGPREILGAGQWRGTIHTIYRNVIPSFIWKSLNQENLPLENSGQTSRDFIYVEDMARGLCSCALKGDSGEVYNLATGVETTILDIASKINTLTGNKSSLDLKPMRDWDRSGKRFASTEKSEKELDFCARIDIDEGLSKTIEWTKKNSKMIAQCIAKHEYFSAQSEIS